jgi:hypothetical protein
VKAKEYLQQIRRLDIAIDDNTEELARLKALATKVTSVVSGDVVSRTREPDTLEKNVEKIIKLKEELDRDIDTFVDMKREIRRMLSQVENPSFFKILYSRYFLYKTWEQIACELGFTYQWTCELHGKALLDFQKILDREKSSDS